MGYTHYWDRIGSADYDAGAFAQAVADFRALLAPLAAAGITVRGPLGEGDPVLTEEEIAFNGDAQCGHPVDSLVVIPWPTPDAGGVRTAGQEAVVGSWFAGSLLRARQCDGDCSYETFGILRAAGADDWGFCKTAFRPYDIAVTACLIILKHRLGDAITVQSDGEDAHWFDAKLLCDHTLGYGLAYHFNGQGHLVASPAGAAPTGRSGQKKEEEAQ